MFTSIFAVLAALASVQVLLVVKLADFLTDGADARNAKSIDADVRNAGIA